jgi:hypothetical protein
MPGETRRGGEFLLGALAGAALMFILDPARGVRRRALARDQLVHAGHELDHLRLAATARARDLRNRARGVLAEARRMRAGGVDDVILEARVRSRLGHHLANPGGVQVSAHDGCVTLAGEALAHETQRLLAAVGEIAGVRDVVDRLTARADAGSVPGLQGRPDPGAGGEL